MLKFKEPHIWNISPTEAVYIQRLLADKIEKECIYNNIQDIKFVAGCDISFNKGSNVGYASVVVLSYPNLEIIEISNHIEEAPINYITGLLSFREAPLLLKALSKLNIKPDIIIYDGQGYAHPRKLGLASHMGVITKIPSIGCAKSMLVGNYDPQESIRGNFSPMYNKDDLIGYALYTKNNCKPIYISIGNMVSLNFAKNFILSCTKKYKLPEPVRLAHINSNKLRKKNKNN